MPTHVATIEQLDPMLCGLHAIDRELDELRRGSDTGALQKDTTTSVRTV